jgi:outer membrane protein insertion porin family
MNRLSLICTMLAITFLTEVASIAADKKLNPEMKIDGAGFFKDRLIKKQLEAIFQGTDGYFEPVDIEDAALIIISNLQSDGYQEAKTIGTITHANGDISTAEWDKNLDVFLPENTRAKKVFYEIIPGPRFYYATLEINENPVLSKEDVEAFFYKDPYFLGSNNSKVFTPPLFTSGAQNLKAHFKNLGYQGVKVFYEVLAIDKNTGAVDVKVSMEAGPLFKLHTVTVENPLPEVFPEDFSDYLNKPFNTFLRQDIIRDVRNVFYASGYAKVAFEHSISFTPISDNEVEVDLELKINPGAQFTISNIRFEGADTVRRSLLKKQLTFEEGALLDPSSLDESRLNVSRLGFFQKVDYQLEDDGENQQSLRFLLKDRTTWELDSLVGWGSYEELRLGIVAEKLNALGMGHRLQLKSIVSNKSLLGETRYLVPNFLDTEFPFSTKLFYLERQELSFDREEFGVTLGTSKYLKWLNMTMDAVYTFGALDARVNDLGTPLEGPDRVRSGSFEMRLGRDKRDNPLNPESGYRIFADIEWGSEAWGGEVDYQAAELGLSYHKEIKRGLIWHGSVSHAVVGSLNKSQSQIPNNKLLFPGGENSIRGYQRGGAAPIDIFGDFVGAKSFMLVNLELEQRFTDSISIVGFFDGLGMTANIDEYPFDEYLSSIGLGIRFRTFMGPVRLEYGHNLNQRIEDPNGTLHLSLGFPF